jgi:hypothetical protein
MKKQSTFRTALMMSMFSAQAALAQEGAVISSVERAIGFAQRIMFIIAGFMVLYGVVSGGISIANSDMDGKKKAGMAVAGGLLVAMAAKIVAAIFQIGG